MEDDKGFEDFADPLMIIMISLDLVRHHYDGLMDKKIITYLDRIDEASHKIEFLLKELQSKHKVYNK